MGEKRQEKNMMLKISEFIVDKRNLIFLLVVIGLIFSAISVNWVKVENNLVEFLPEDSATKQGLDLMEEEFMTFATAQVMVANVTLSKAYELQELLEQIDGVWSVEFDDSAAHYNNVSVFKMSMLINSEEVMKKLEDLQSKIEPTKVILSGSYMCDCTGCSNGCFEFCSDGNGPSN